MQYAINLFRSSVMSYSSAVESGKLSKSASWNTSKKSVQPAVCTNTAFARAEEAVQLAILTGGNFSFGQKLMYFFSCHRHPKFKSTKRWT